MARETISGLCSGRALLAWPIASPALTMSLSALRAETSKCLGHATAGLKPRAMAAASQQGLIPANVLGMSSSVR